MEEKNLFKYSYGGEDVIMKLKDGTLLKGAIFKDPGWKICPTRPTLATDWSDCTSFKPDDVVSIAWA